MQIIDNLKYVFKRKPLPYFLLNAIGILFHTSAILYLPLYFVFKFKRKEKIELFLFILGIIIYLFQISIIKQLFITFSGLFSGKIGFMVKNYLQSDNYSSSYGLTLGFIERVFTFCLLFKFSKNIIAEDSRMKVFWYLFLLFEYSYLYFSDFKILVERIPNFFICSYWVLYPKVFGKLKKEFKYIFLILLLFYGAIRTASLMNQSWGYYDNFLVNSMSAEQRKSLYSTNGY